MERGRKSAETAQSADNPSFPLPISRFPLRWNPLRPGELDHELIWLCVSIFSGAFLVAWLRLGLPTPTCPFHDITGYPCLTCGATRCFIQLLQGHPGAALRFNPGVFAAIFALGLYNGYAFTVLVFRLPRLRLWPVSPRVARWVRIGVVTLLALNWAYLVRVLP